MGHVLGAEKGIFLIRADAAHGPPKKLCNLGPMAPRSQGMLPGLYAETFGLGERLGCILNLGHSFDAIEAYL